MNSPCFGVLFEYITPKGVLLGHETQKNPVLALQVRDFSGFDICAQGLERRIVKLIFKP